jgi:hypothetical protein
VAHDDRGLVQGRVIGPRDARDIDLGKREALAGHGGMATGAEDVEWLCHAPTLGRVARPYQMKDFMWEGGARQTCA